MTAFPDGHFYSPVNDPEELRHRESEIWPPEAAEPPGLDLALGAQRRLLEGMREVAQDFDYPHRKDLDESDDREQASGDARFAFQDGNGLFDGLDARMLFCMLRHAAPSRMVEVGSGFSSLLTADVNRRFLDAEMEFTCIEPYPRPFLTAGVPGITDVIVERVERVGLEPFTGLESGDVLFIDSSHVTKTGNDVNFLYFQVLPRLEPGVLVHIHDIFFPDDYPKTWVLEQGRSWNEQYLVQALLMFSDGFEVVFGSHCATRFFPEVVESLFSGSYGGGSLWIRRTGGGRRDER